MEKYFMLAAPLLALSLLAGCCSDGNCYSSASIDNSSVVVARVEVAEESPAVAVAAPTRAEEKAPVAAVRPAPAPEMTRESATTKVMARIPAVKLPEGWAYIDESELSGGQVSAEPVAMGGASASRNNS